MKPHSFLFFSHRTITLILYVVLISQLSTIIVSSLVFSSHNAFVITQESEEPKPNEGKNVFDFLEESKFIVANVFIFPFFSEVLPLPIYKDLILLEVLDVLDSPPPEVA